MSETILQPPQVLRPQRQDKQPIPVLPPKKELVATAKAELLRSFGHDYDIPEPPDALYEDYEHLIGLGIRKFEPYYQPEIAFDPKVELDPKKPPTLPIWAEGVGIKPERLFWELLSKGNIAIEGATLPEGWILRDGRSKPNFPPYNDAKTFFRDLRYEDDERIELMMYALRNQGMIHKPPYYRNYKPSYPSDYSYLRFDTTSNELRKVIVPHFSTLIGARGIVDYPTALEFNIEGNTRHPEWGKTSTCEWFSDKVVKPLIPGVNTIPGPCIYGGGSEYGGLADVDEWALDSRADNIGFRFQIRYPSKA